MAYRAYAAAVAAVLLDTIAAGQPETREGKKMV